MEMTMINNCYEPDREETIDKILCNRCKHRRKGITCDAFPDGIPIEIIRSGEHFLFISLFSVGDCIHQQSHAGGHLSSSDLS